MTFLAAAGGARPVTDVLIQGYVSGQEKIVSVDLVAEDDHDGLLLMASEEGWLQLSVDSGNTWAAVGGSVDAGAAIPPMVTGERRTLLLKVKAPVGVQTRRAGIELVLGLGS